MISPALHFNGTCEESLNLNERVFAATDKQIQYYREAPADPGFPVTDGMTDKVMHASLTICGTPVNFADSTEPIAAGNMICLNVFLDSADGVRRAYEGLKDGGTDIY